MMERLFIITDITRCMVFQRPPAQQEQQPEQPQEPLWDTPVLDAILGSDRPRVFDRSNPIIPNQVWQNSRKVSGTILAVNLLRFALTGI